MQTVHHQYDPTQQGLTPDDHRALRELTANAVAYAEEVRSLRQRVAELELELAAIKSSQVIESPTSHAVALTANDHASRRLPASPPASEFAESVQPAVVAVTPAPAAAPANAEPPSAPDFAQAWEKEVDDLSFEERMAEEAFFRASTVDEQSRNWLLDT